MAIRQIKLFPDKELLTPCQKVENFEEISDLIKDLEDTLKFFEGVGLAAPQIGVSKQVFVIDLAMIRGEEGSFDPISFINPRIIKASKETQTLEEGCLSMPSILLPIERPRQVSVRAQDLEGNLFDYEGTGYLAAALQHEIDHLRGDLFIKHASSIRRKMAMRQYKKSHKIISQLYQEAAKNA